MSLLDYQQGSTKINRKIRQSDIPMKPVFGSLLLVAGMVMVITVPIVGVALLGVGYWMLESCSAGENQATGDAFVGIAAVCIAANFLIT